MWIKDARDQKILVFLFFILYILINTEAGQRSIKSDLGILFRQTKKYSPGSFISFNHESGPIEFLKKPPSFVRTLAKNPGKVIECVSAGTNVITYWAKNGVPIEKDISNHHPLGDINRSFETAKLSLSCLSPEDAGTYSCISENAFRKNQTDVLVSVETLAPSHYDCFTNEIKPYIYLATRTRVEYIGSSVRIHCRANGIPKPIISWRSSKIDSIVNSDKFEISSNGDLTINHLTWEDMGGYECKAENIKGYDTAEVFVYPLTLNLDSNGQENSLT